MTEEKLPATVKGLSLVSFFNDIASEMIYPLLPAFLTGTLGASAVSLGALDGAADLTSAGLKWVTGRLSDRPGWRKPLILVGYGTAVLVRPLIAVANAAWQVIGFRVIDRVGKGLRTAPRDAMLAESTPPALHGRAFGFHSAADHLGAMLGSLTAWFVVSRGVEVRRVIGWSAAPGIIAVIVLAIVLKGQGKIAAGMGRETRDERRATNSTKPSPRGWGAFLVSRLSFLVLAAGMACDPGTTRPDLTPFPEARTIEVLGDRDSALAVLRYALTADSFPIARVSARDHWLESPWFDARTLAPTGARGLGPEVMKLRGWADPSRPGASLLIIELVYRPMADPSLPPRELERPVATTDSVYARLGRALKLVSDSVGAHFDDKPSRH